MRFTLERPTLFFSHCHCASCRRAHAAPLVSWTAVPAARFRWRAEATLRAYASSHHATRSFCGRCGTQVHYVSTEWPDKVYVPVATLDGLPDQPPDGHVNSAEAVDWLILGDGLPRDPGLG